MKKMLTLIALAAMLSACSSLLYPSSGISSLEIGMTMKEVVDRMGRNYEVVEASVGRKVLQYYTSETDFVYRLYFSGDVLMEWKKEYKYPYRPYREHEPGASVKLPRDNSGITPGSIAGQ